MITLALDPSTTVIGWALFDGTDYLDSGVFVPDGEHWYRRVMAFRSWLFEVFCGYPSPIEYDDINRVAFEWPTGNRGNMKTNVKLGGPVFVIRSLCHHHNRPCMSVTASQVIASGCHKKALQVASSIAGREIASGDEADAIGVALAAIKKEREGGEW